MIAAISSVFSVQPFRPWDWKSRPAWIAAEQVRQGLRPREMESTWQIARLRELSVKPIRTKSNALCGPATKMPAPLLERAGGGNALEVSRGRAGGSSDAEVGLLSDASALSHDLNSRRNGDYD